MKMPLCRVLSVYGNSETAADDPFCCYDLRCAYGVIVIVTLVEPDA